MFQPFLSQTFPVPNPQSYCHFTVPNQFQIGSHFCNRFFQFQIIIVYCQFCKMFSRCSLSSKFSSYLHSPLFKHPISSPLINLIISDYLVNKFVQTIVWILLLFSENVAPSSRVVVQMITNLKYPLERDIDYCSYLKKMCTPNFMEISVMKLMKLKMPSIKLNHSQVLIVSSKIHHPWSVFCS